MIMKNLVLTMLAFCVAGCLMANAQPRGFHGINAGLEIAMPLGDFGSAYGVGFGASGKAFYGITEMGDITGSLGYIHFGMKNTTEHMSGNIGMVPILFGYRHHFDAFYVEPQLGPTIARSKVSMDDFGLGLGNISGSYSDTKFSFAAGGGYLYGNFDFGARFQLTDNLNFFGIRAAYKFEF